MGLDRRLHHIDQLGDIPARIVIHHIPGLDVHRELLVRGHGHVDLLGIPAAIRIEMDEGLLRCVRGTIIPAAAKIVLRGQVAFVKAALSIDDLDLRTELLHFSLIGFIGCI